MTDNEKTIFLKARGLQVGGSETTKPFMGYVSDLGVFQYPNVDALLKVVEELCQKTRLVRMGMDKYTMTEQFMFQYLNDNNMMKPLMELLEEIAKNDA